MNKRIAVNSPLVSVVMGCYNSERFLVETIESVLTQTYPHFELIAVDDCSSDSTLALLEAAAARDKRVRIVRRQTRGGRPAITKNTALEHVRGKYVCFIDHDDIFLPTKLERSVAMLESHPDCVAAFHDMLKVDAQRKPLSRYLEGFVTDATAYLQRCGADTYLCSKDFFKFQSIHYAAIHTVSVMIALDRVDRSQVIYDTQYRVVDDTDLWIRLGMQGELGYVDAVLAEQRIHGNNITGDKLGWSIDATQFFAHNYRRVHTFMNPAEKQAYRTRIADSLDDMAWRMRCAGLHWSAATTYAKALAWQVRPSSAINVFKAFLPTRGPH